VNILTSASSISANSGRQDQHEISDLFDSDSDEDDDIVLMHEFYGVRRTLLK
jgi:hypothetical protein